MSAHLLPACRVSLFKAASTSSQGHHHFHHAQRISPVPPRMAAHAAPLRSPAPVAKTKIEPLTYRVKMHLSTTLDNVISEAKQYVEREHAEGRREVEVLQYICWILNEVQKSIHAEYAGFQKRLADDIWGVVREAAKETLKDGPGRPRVSSPLLSSPHRHPCLLPCSQPR